VCGRDDSFIYLKVDDNAACPWAKPGDDTAKWFYGTFDSAFVFNFDHPVAGIDPNKVPPG